MWQKLWQKVTNLWQKLWQKIRLNLMKVEPFYFAYFERFIDEYELINLERWTRVGTVFITSVCFWWLHMEYEGLLGEWLLLTRFARHYVYFSKKQWRNGIYARYFRTVRGFSLGEGVRNCLPLQYFEVVSLQSVNGVEDKTFQIFNLICIIKNTQAFAWAFLISFTIRGSFHFMDFPLKQSHYF